MGTLVASLQGWGATGILLAIALCIWRPGYRWLRHLGTLVHEVGHAVAGLLTGARLRGIALRSDSSGVTTTGHVTGIRGAFSRFITTIAGYPAPGVFAVTILMGFVVMDSPYKWSWWTMLAMSVLCVIFARSWFTFVVAIMFAVLPVLFLFLWTDAPEAVQSAGLWFICTVLIWCGYRGMLELTHISRKEPHRETDATSVRQATGLPLMLSTGLLWALTVLIPVVVYILATLIADRLS